MSDIHAGEGSIADEPYRVHRLSEGYVLAKGYGPSAVLSKRTGMMRQFKRTRWSTYAGAAAAARKLNAAQGFISEP